MQRPGLLGQEGIVAAEIDLVVKFLVLVLVGVRILLLASQPAGIMDRAQRRMFVRGHAACGKPAAKRFQFGHDFEHFH